MNKPPAGFELAGQIGVDAGLCMIADPCYWIERPADQAMTWPEFIDILDGGTLPMEIPFDNGVGGRGVVFRSGYGDGTYNVYVKKDPRGRVIAALVLFDEEVEDGHGPEDQ